VQAHDVVRGIMQDQIDVIERDDARESLAEIMKQVAQVSVHRNCFRNLQKGLVLLAGAKRLSVS
jgi:hypothetical protein